MSNINSTCDGDSFRDSRGVAESLLPETDPSIRAVSSDEPSQEYASCAGEHWACRLSGDRLVLDLPVDRVRPKGGIFITTLLWCIALLIFGSAWAAGNVLGKPHFVSLGAAAATIPALLAIFATYECPGDGSKFKQIIFEPTRLLTAGAPSGRKRLEEHPLLAQSRAIVDSQGDLSIDIGLRNLELCWGLEDREAKRVRDQINSYLDCHRAERPYYVERPVTGGVVCNTDGSRLTIIFPPLQRWKPWRIQIATLVLLGTASVYHAFLNGPIDWYQLLPFLILSLIVVLHQVWAVVQDRHTRVWAMIEPSRLVVTHDRFGRIVQREFSLDQSSRAAPDAQIHGRSMHFAIAIRNSATIGHFGKIQSYDDAVVIAERINEHLRRSRERSESSSLG